MTEPRRVYLRAIRPTNLQELVDLMSVDDVWRNFDFVAAPRMDTGYRLALAMKHWGGCYIHTTDDDRVVGVIILEGDGRKITDTAEVDIAITDPSVRGQGLSLQALWCLFDDWLLGEKVARFHAWVDASNGASQGMIKAMRIPVIGDGTRRMSDGRVLEGVYIEMDKAQWQRVRDELGTKLKIPETPYVMA